MLEAPYPRGRGLYDLAGATGMGADVRAARPGDGNHRLHFLHAHLRLGEGFFALSDTTGDENLDVVRPRA